MRRRVTHWRMRLAAMAAAVLAARAHGALLPSGDWSVVDASGTALIGVADNDLSTAGTARGGELEALAIVIDLKKPHVLHRVFIGGGRPPAAAAGPEVKADGLADVPAAVAARPKALTVFVGADLANMRRVGEAEIPKPSPGVDEVAATLAEWRFDLDLRFPSAAGRYVRLAPSETDTELAWAVAELELYGSAEARAFTPCDAVVVATNAPFPLQLAAWELQYYLGELTGVPLPIVAPEACAAFTGMLYRVATPPPLPPYTNLVTRPAIDYERVSVVRDGRSVVFSGPVERTVLFGVYHFLDLQGVRWLAPDPHGDAVPAGRGVDLGVLPVDYSPPIKVRHFSGNTQRYFSRTDAAYLWVWRNRWNSTWGGEYNTVIGALPRPARAPWFGHPHSLGELVPASLFDQHPEWFPFFREDSPHAERIAGKGAWKPQAMGRRVPYATTWGLNPCLGNPEVAAHAAQRIIDSTEPKRAYALCTVVPQDAGIWCECERCRAMDVELAPDPLVGWGDRIISDRYFGFVRQVAERTAAAVPNVRLLALAYNDYHKPPASVDRLPDNVLVDVLQYGNYNLPWDGSDRNREMRRRLKEWRTKTAHLGIYDHSLLLGSKGEDMKLPVPLLAAYEDRFRLYHSLGAEYLEVEARMEPGAFRYNPWNFYACGRHVYYPAQTRESILLDFFTGYYGESAEPMRRCYEDMEQALNTRGISLGNGCNYGLAPGAFGVDLLRVMDAHLAEAERLARYWVTLERVAAVRSSLDWLVEEQGLKGVSWKDDSAFPEVRAKGAALALDLPSLGIRRQFVRWDRGALLFEAHGAAGTHVRIAGKGVCTVTVTARAVPYQDVWPEVRVMLGSVTSGPVSIASTEYRDYTFRADAESGIHALLLDYRNAAEGGRRNVLVQAVRVEMVLPGPPSD